MVKPLEKTPAKVGRRKKLKQVKQNLQATANSILWLMVHGVGGSMDIPVDEVGVVPQNANIDIKFDTEKKCFVVTAIAPEKKLIEVATRMPG